MRVLTEVFAVAVAVFVLTPTTSYAIGTQGNETAVQFEDAARYVYYDQEVSVLMSGTPPPFLTDEHRCDYFRESSAAWKDLEHNATRYKDWTTYLISFLPFSKRPCWAKVKDGLSDACKKPVIPSEEMLELAIDMSDCSDEDEAEAAAAATTASGSATGARGSSKKVQEFLKRVAKDDSMQRLLRLDGYIKQIPHICMGVRFDAMNTTVEKNYAECLKCTNGLRGEKAVRIEAEQACDRARRERQAVYDSQLRDKEEVVISMNRTVDAMKETVKEKGDALDRMDASLRSCRIELADSQSGWLWTFWTFWESVAFTMGTMMQTVWEFANIAGCYLAMFCGHAHDGNSYATMCIGEKAKTNGFAAFISINQKIVYTVVMGIVWFIGGYFKRIRMRAPSQGEQHRQHHQLPPPQHSRRHAEHVEEHTEEHAEEHVEDHVEDHVERVNHDANQTNQRQRGTIQRGCVSQSVVKTVGHHPGRVYELSGQDVPKRASSRGRRTRKPG